ncbi:tetratricopeptide repeat protein [uncultured Imperialibacter sp.]|uniref:tetratricopeptide repeat protein n=1 Tax=uncultured Imperialibacter sp. TaxID=1672639 RepID=UPI0030D9A5EC|tara:strand:+ start:3815 stop:5836 length:2022 start_codon:yes stop_codon:yes gene_type:complete
MTRYKLTPVFVLLSYIVVAQSPSLELRRIDSLIRNEQFDEAAAELERLEDAQVGNFEVDLLRGDLYLSKGDNSKAIEYYSKLKSIPVPENKELALKLAKGINDLGIAYYRVGQMDSAEAVHHRSVSIYKSWGDQQGLSYNYNNLALIARQRKEIDSAITYHQKSLEAAQKANDTLGVGYNYLNMALLEADNKSRLKALDYFYKAKDVFRQADNQKMIAVLQTRMSGLYIRLGVYDSAASMLRKAKTYYQSSENPVDLMALYVKMAQLFYTTDQPDSAIYYVEKTKKMAQDNNSSHYLGRIYAVEGRVMKKQKNYIRAIEAYKKSIETYGKNFVGLSFISAAGLSAIYLEQEKYELANYTALDALEKVGNSPNPEAVSQVYEVLYHTNKQQGRPSEALRYLEKFKTSQDSLYDKEKSYEMARIEYRDYLEMKERQEAAERERIQLTYEQQLERERWIRLSATSGATLLLIILILIYRLYSNKKRDHRLLEHKNETIEAKNEELRAKNEELLALREKDQKNQETERRLLRETIFLKDRELAATAMINHEKNNILSNIGERLDDIHSHAKDSLKEDLRQLKRFVETNVNDNETWNSFIHQFEQVHPDFFHKLKDRFSDMSVNDLKLCAYIKVGMDNKQIANASNLALSTVKKNINRVKKKISLTPEESIRDFLLAY